MKTILNKVATERRRLVDKTNEQLREIQLYFNSVNYWNNSIRKPNEAIIDGDPDGQMKKIADALAECLRRESKHKISLIQWLAEIKRAAIEKYEYTQYGADHTDWEQYAHDYYLDCTPEEAIVEDMKNA
jgi:hypothetical protein